MQRERDSGMTMRSEDQLDFTTFGELAEIIKANWSIFGSIFNSVKAVEKVMMLKCTSRAYCSLYDTSRGRSVTSSFKCQRLV